MKIFTITRAQIANVIGAVAADEVSRRFNRHFDFLTIASWDPETQLRAAAGLALNEQEYKACARRAAHFFGQKEELLLESKAEKIDDWAMLLADAVGCKLESFSFKAAARDDPNAASVHSADEIYQDAAAAANLLHGRRRLLSFVSPHSLLGFILSILTANLLGVPSVDARGMTPEELSKSLRFGDVLIATPTLWRYMVREKLSSPDNTMAVTFGEPMTPDLDADMRKCGFGAMRELYGSTETGLIGWRDAPGEPFMLFEHWERDHEALVRRSPSGAERPVSPMDAFDWVGARGFQLLGRRDGAVQIGAVNVFPNDVAKALREHPKITDCKLVVDRRGDGVSRLVAHIVLDHGVKPDENTAREIDAWCRLNLRQQERPRIYNFETAI